MPAREDGFLRPVQVPTTPATPCTKREWSGSIQDILFPANFRLRRETDWKRYHQAVRLTCRLYGVEEHTLTLFDAPWEPEARDLGGARGPGWELDEDLCKAIIYFNIDQGYVGEERYVDFLWELSASDMLDTVERVHDAEEELGRCCSAGSGKFWVGMVVVVALLVQVVVLLYVTKSGISKA